jgi:hypothetical protein
MSQRPDEHGQLVSLLRALPVVEPSSDFVAGARRRYREAIDARDRREVVTGLVAALLALVLVATLLASIEPAIVIVGWLAEASADAARWLTGAGVVLSLVPPVFWASAALGFAAAALSLVLLARARPLAIVK